MSPLYLLLGLPLLTLASPAVRISSSTGSHTYVPDASIDLTFTFSTCVEGFEANDVVLTRDGASVVDGLSGFDGSSQVFKSSIRPEMGDDATEYCVRVGQGAASAGSRLSQESDTVCFSVRGSAPLKATLLTTAPSAKLADGQFTIPFTVNFGELEVRKAKADKATDQGSSGFASGDWVVSTNDPNDERAVQAPQAAYVDDLQMSDTSWTFNVVGPPGSLVCVKIPAGIASDMWWQPNEESGEVCVETGISTPCELTDFSDWSACDQAYDSATGAARGKQYRSKRVIQQATGNANICPFPRPSEERACQIPGWESCRGESNQCRIQDYGLSNLESYGFWLRPKFEKPAGVTGSGLGGGQCSCDDGCFAAGDCCPDRASLCGGQIETCFNRCGESPPTTNSGNRVNRGICECDNFALNDGSSCGDIENACKAVEVDISSCAFKGCGSDLDRDSCSCADDCGSPGRIQCCDDYRPVCAPA
jgi:hypothetical protein